MIHRNNPKHEIFRFDIQSEMATETEFKTLLSCLVKVIESIKNGILESNLNRNNLLP